METTVHCKSGLPFPLPCPNSGVCCELTHTNTGTYTHIYNWQAQMLFLPCCQSRASQETVPRRRGGRGCHSNTKLKRRSTVQQLLGENNMDNLHTGKYMVLSQGEYPKGKNEWAVHCSSLFSVKKEKVDMQSLIHLYDRGPHYEWWAQHTDILLY